MRVEPIGATYWAIVRDRQPPRYFWFASGRGSWTKNKSLAHYYGVREVAERKLASLRMRAKVGREQGLFRKPKPLAEYCWTEENKILMLNMVAIGCGWPAIAVQTGRTEAACRAMWNLIQKAKQ